MDRLQLLDDVTYTVLKACQRDYVHLKIGHFVTTLFVSKIAKHYTR